MPPSPPPPRRAAARPRAELLLPLALLLLLAAAVWQMLASGDEQRVVGSHERGSPEATGSDEHAAAAEAVAPTPAAERTAELQAEAPFVGTIRPTAPFDLDDSTPDPPTAPPILPVTLHVIDRASGAPLPQVEVRCSELDDHLRRLASTPSRSERLLTAGASPLQLLPKRDWPRARVLVVEASGYAPETLTVDWHSGGERTVALAAATRLTVEVTGAPREERLYARLYSRESIASGLERGRRLLERNAASHPAGRSAAMERELDAATRLLATPRWSAVSLELMELLARLAPDRADPIDSQRRVTFTDLPISGWIVVIGSVAMFDDRFVHAVGEVELAPGDDARLLLAWQPTPTPLRVAVTGRVVLGPGWLASDMPALPDRIAIRSLDPFAEREVSGRGRIHRLEPGPRADTLHFALESLPPGEAVAWFAPWRYSTRFVVPASPAGTAEVELQIPPPAVVTVRVVGSDVAQPLIPCWYDWVAADDREGTIGLGGGESTQAIDGIFTLVVPAAELALAVGSEPNTVWVDFTRHVVGSGATTIERTLREPSELRVTLREGDAQVPLDGFDAFHCIQVHGKWVEGITRAEVRGADSSIRLQVNGEGPATLIVDGLEGYRPSEPVAVELVRGGTVAIEVELVRERRPSQRQ
ncbi:MAG: hypothetical protein JNL90_00630 [Planctomycetes bacterium]|nr:hypothetical protein [Planctomycetota bacterium]